MSKLAEWLAAAGVAVAIWLGLLTNTVENSFAKNHYTLVLLSPIIFVGLFGLSSLALVLYRVYTFNDCDEAAEELQKEIVQARAELTQLGFKFKETSRVST